jgi:tRNA(Ile2) C34 agmatinyltransferase TiaS
MMKYIIAIDDTDNLESRGTGFQARQLGLSIENRGIGKLKSVVRHQLFVHENIPYTSHNSSASIAIESTSDKNDIIELCKNFLLENAATGSDAGLCVAEYDNIGDEICEWGNNAKKIILNKENAHLLAKKNSIYLEGFTGEKIGVIGALAAVGLHKNGNDGRILWVRNLRETTGIFIASELKKAISVENVLDMDFNSVSGNSIINITSWTRPVMRDNKITLIVKKDNNEKHEFTSAPKEFIKSITE